MYSKATELTGLTFIAVGVAVLLGTGAGLLAGGLALLLIGSTTDDAQVALALRRASARFRFYWHRQVLRENLLKGSPHPEIQIDPEMEALAERLKVERQRRGDGRTRQGVP